MYAIRSYYGRLDSAVILSINQQAGDAALLDSLQDTRLLQAVQGGGQGAQIRFGGFIQRRLKAMLRDGQLVKNRRGAYGLPARMDLVAGRVSAHPDGYGFLIPDDGEGDLYLAPRQMRSVLHGDRVLASVVGIVV